MTTFYCLRSDTPPTWRADHRFYIPQEQGDKVITPGTGFHIHHLLRLAGLMWRYSTPRPYGRTSELINLIVKITPAARATSKMPFFYCYEYVRFRGNVFTEPLLGNGLHDSDVLLLRTCMLRALPSNGRCLHNHFLATGISVILCSSLI
jgi:hypothetical protein